MAVAALADTLIRASICKRNHPRKVLAALILYGMPLAPLRSQGARRCPQV